MPFPADEAGADSRGADEAVARLWILNDLPLMPPRRTLYWLHAGRWLSGRKRPPAKRVRGVKLLRGFESLPSRQAAISVEKSQPEVARVSGFGPPRHFRSCRFGGIRGP